MEHNFYEGKDFTSRQIDDDTWLTRAVIDGGLAICKTCNQMEGALTTECIGFSTGASFGDFSYEGELDIKEGKILLSPRLFNIFTKVSNSERVIISDNELRMFQDIKQSDYKVVEMKLEVKQ